MTTKIDKNFSDKCDELMKDLPKPTAQEETIVWHKYPEEKPPIPKSMIWFDGSIKYRREYLVDCFEQGRFELVNWDGNHFIDIDEQGIFAWAELPKGWMEK